MLPRKEFTSDINSSIKGAKSDLECLIGESKTFLLTSTFTSGGNTFRLTTRKTLGRLIFKRPILLAEIKGEIKENKIRFRIGLGSSLMNAIVYINSFILLLVSYGLFYSGEIEPGFLLLGFTGFILIFCYFLLKTEIKYLEKELRKIKRIKPAGNT